MYAPKDSIISFPTMNKINQITTTLHLKYNLSININVYEFVPGTIIRKE